MSSSSLRIEKSTVKVLKGVCDLKDDCNEKEEILCGAGSLCCDNCFIPIHEKCDHEFGWFKETIFFCSCECLTEKKTSDDDGYFKSIKNSLYKFSFMFNGKSFDSFQSPNSSIIELKAIISYNISSLENPNSEVTDIIYGGTRLRDNIIIKIQFITQCVHHIKIIVKNILNHVEPFVKHNDCIVCPKLPINNADLTNLSTELSKKSIKLTNVITALNKVDQTTNEFATDNADSINLPIKFTKKQFEQN